MRLFGKRVPQPESSGNDADDLTLQAIVKQGGDLTRPRHWVHYLYFPGEDAARIAASRVADAGWDLQLVDKAAIGDGSWIVIPERRDVVVNGAAVREARAFFEGVVARVPGADYDGWEASV
jgi:hypothetical protein